MDDIITAVTSLPPLVHSGIEWRYEGVELGPHLHNIVRRPRYGNKRCEEGLEYQVSPLCVSHGS